MFLNRGTSLKIYLLLASILTLVAILYMDILPYFHKNANNYEATSDDLNRRVDKLASTSDDLNRRVDKLASNERSIDGTCSEAASRIGDHQKIISYSFLNSNPYYSRGFSQILQNISISYVGWFVRIYASGEDISFLKTVVKDRDFVFYCDIDHLPPPLNTVRPYPVTMWRFAPLGDPQVDIMMSRDSDSPILQRELDAVNEWLNRSKKSLHIMRDHPKHGTQVLGGLWGLNMINVDKTHVRKIRDKMYKSAYGSNNTRIDQTALQNIFWKVFKTDFIAHDSYLCKRYPGSSPWPTQRSHDKNFVGSTDYRGYRQEVPEPCPVECRPKTHQDWEYC